MNKFFATLGLAFPPSRDTTIGVLPFLLVIWGGDGLMLHLHQSPPALLAGLLAGQTLLAALLLGRHLRRARRPLEAAATRIRAMADGRLPLAPLPGGDAKTELAALIAGFNALQGKIIRSEADLWTASRRVKAILANTPTGIAIVLADRTILEANPAFCDIFGWDLDKVIGHTTHILYETPEIFLKIGAEAYPLILAGGTFHRDLPMRGKSGKALWVDVTGHLVDRGDPSLGIVWAAEDVTDRVEDGQRLAGLLHDRETQTAELNRSNAELEQFAYVASHDLRQPLRQVASFVTLLERDYGAHLDDEARNFIAFARSGAERMDKLIAGLLDYSRIGRGGLAMEPLALPDIIAEARDTLEIPLRETAAILETADHLPEIIGCRSELVRLFQNLIGNAIQYRPADRPPHIRISWRCTDRELVISVADNGIGIAPEHFERIFGIFQRLHPRNRYEGTGIGLAICRKIADHHKGRIWVESLPGKGTTFHTAFPLETALPIALPPARQSA